MNRFISPILSLMLVLLFLVRVLGDNSDQPLTAIAITTETVVVQTAEPTTVIDAVFSIEMFNKLNKQELMEFPGVGEVTADAILDYIELHGPFTSFDELIHVKGIGPKKLEKILQNLP